MVVAVAVAEAAVVSHGGCGHSLSVHLWWPHKEEKGPQVVAVFPHWQWRLRPWQQCLRPLVQSTTTTTRAVRAITTNAEGHGWAHVKEGGTKCQPRCCSCLEVWLL
jgi:hypothetical protein